MTFETIEKLNKINKEFYEKIAIYFDSSRQYFWDGWNSVWNFVIENKLAVNSVLDIGCGNGRFLKFLLQRKEALCHQDHESAEYEGSILTTDFSYLGIDFDNFLLDKAKELSSKKYSFKNIDLLEEWNLSQKFDLITSFGVIHHIASFEKRLDFLRKMKDVISENGIIAISIWKFMDDEREKSKVKDWSSISINQSELEENDFLLSWNRGENAVRYCHYVSNQEEKELIQKSGLKLIKEFYADGKSGRKNKYLILSKY